MNRVLCPLVFCLLLAGCRGSETAAPGVDPLFGPTTVPPPPTGAAAMVDPYYANPNTIGRQPASGNVPTTPLAERAEPQASGTASLSAPEAAEVQTAAAEKAPGEVRTATYEEPIPARRGDVIRIPDAALDPSEAPSPPPQPAHDNAAVGGHDASLPERSEASSTASTDDGWRPNPDAALRPMEDAVVHSSPTPERKSIPRGPIVRTLYPATEGASTTTAATQSSPVASQPEIVDISSLPPAPTR